MRVAFVVQRYGANVVGGAEQGCRQLAQLMAKDWQVSVITTCAKNYLTWENELASGEEADGDVTVYRFPVERARNFSEFSSKSAQVEQNAYRLSADDEAQRFIDQGPYSPAMVEFIEKNRDRFDRFIFYTYLYYSTVAGLPKVADKAYLITTAHDEGPLYFVRTFAPIFHSLRGLIYLSDAERDLVNRIYKVPAQVQQHTIGLGVADPMKLSSNQIAEIATKFESIVGDGEFVLYVGRIAPAKGCREMLEAFQRYRRRGNKFLNLVLVGATEIEIPQDPSIRYLGYVSEAEKSYLLSRCRALINPSHLESFSIVIMEAWQHGRPVLVNAASEVMKNYCDRSDGGLYYYSPTMFDACLEWLSAYPHESNLLGSQGKEFVQQNFGWDRIRQRMLETIN
jgi:glycosyltransferase involved in cell wall biosynthesis